MFSLGVTLLSLGFLSSGLFGGEPAEPSPRRVPSRRGLGVVWWNIEHGLTNAQIGTNPLGHNLSALVCSAEAPEVLVLGEFREGAIDAGTRALLRAKYQEFFYPYSPESRGMGLWIGVAPGIRVEAFPVRWLDWTPTEARSELERRAYRRRWSHDYPDCIYFTRSYARLRLTRGEASFNLVPIHFIQPWEKLAEDRRFFGTLSATWSLFLGRRHPLMYQVRRFRAHLLEDFGPGLDSEPLVVIGDLNLTRRTPAYRLLKDGLREVFTRPAVTFPALDADRVGRYPRLQIDHAFTNASLDVSEARVLPLQGSDHYAIELRLQSPALTQSVDESANVLPLEYRESHESPPQFD
jgi:endonuclease/exonuclease/phosphatase family metal-dependent hydrolase